MHDFIVVGACNTLLTQVLLAIREFSSRRTVVIGGPNTIAVRRSLLCTAHSEIDFEKTDETRFIHQVNAQAARMKNAVLIAADCAAARLVNRLRHSLEVNVAPIADTPTLDMFDDKWQFFQFCREHGLSVPATIYVGDKSRLDHDQLAAQLGSPFIIKPINQAGSAGVQVIRDKAHCEREINRNGAYQFDQLIAQRYIDGTDACIDLLAVHGRVRALAFQRRSRGAIEFFADQQLEDIAHCLAKTSKYNGIMNLDVRIEKGSGKAFLLESNPRFWASLAASAGCGLNFVAESVAAAEKPDPVRMLVKGAYQTRHPLVRPSAWWSLLFDYGSNGRLMRARVSDFQGLNGMAKSVATKPWAHLPKLLGKARENQEFHIQRR